MKNEKCLFFSGVNYVVGSEEIVNDFLHGRDILDYIDGEIVFLGKRCFTLVMFLTTN